MNEVEGLQLTDTQIASANKANALAAQANTIAAASAGSTAFLSAAAYLAANPEVKGYQK